VVSRRTLLLGGVVLVAGGCGEDEAPSASSALLASLAAERAFGAAATASPRIAVRSRERADALAAAVSEAGGRPHDAPAPSDGSGDPVEIGRAAIAAHIAALPALDRRARRLGADLVAGAATDVAVLGDERGEQAADAFPGSGT
jgi:hypothetical protein